MNGFHKLKQTIKRHKHKITLSVSFLSIVSFFSLFFINAAVKREIAENTVLDFPFAFSKAASYPKIQSVLGLATQESISAKSFVVMDGDSQVVLLSKNERLRFSMASTTKIMTALTALSHFKINDILTVYNPTIEGARVGIFANEQLTFENLLYGMLLPSGNDAAIVIAQNYPGGISSFVEQMNANAKTFSLYNTHFSDPTGLSDENYTTALDLARLASIALQNETFARVVSTQHKEIVDTTGVHTYFVSNINKLLGIDGVNGVKTGFTEEAGEVLVTSRANNGHTIFIVVMKSEDRFSDTKKLLQLVEEKLSYVKPN